MRLKMVVLPAPLGPISENTSCGQTSKETSLTARRPPNCTDRFCACSSGEVMRTAPLAGSFQSFRLHIAFLPPEHALAVEGEDFEEGADLVPVGIQAERLAPGES